MLVTVIIPCRNEAAHLGRCLDSVLTGTWSTADLQLLVVDGRSTDGTRAIAERYAEAHSCVTLLDNPARTAPAALNLGLAAARGEVIVRMDAHVLYPRDYLARLIRDLETSGADNVGGRIVTTPGGSGIVARAIARAMSHPFGVGNAHFRLATRTPRFVDTVPFGCYRREVFTRLGQFDEELVRNQDDEFNARLLRSGGRILLDPAIVARYVARTTYAQLARMYYQYGFYKPLVVRKVGAVMTWRQLVPVSALLFGGVCALLGLVSPAAAIVALGLAVTYATAAIAVAWHAVRLDGSGAGVAHAVALAVAFAVLHASYGWGYLRGLRAFLPPRWRGMAPAAPLSR